MKLAMIMLMLVASQMTIVGTFLTTGVSGFYMNGFYRQLNSVFGPDQREFVTDLRNAAGDDNGAESLRKMLDANAGPLGIDYRTRNYFVLDGTTGAWLAGSAGEDALPMEQSPNLLTARVAVARGDASAVGDDSYLNAAYMDAAIPILSDEQSFIIYILDSQETLSGLNRQLFHIILQSLTLSLLITALLSFLLSKTMVGPLEKLTAGAEEVAAGKFGAELPVESADEIGILTGTFNEMAGVLHTTLDQIENERTKLDTLFLYMTDGVVAFDTTGTVIHCNPAAVNMLQRKVEIGSEYNELFGGLFAFGDVLALKRPNHAEGEMMVGERTLELLLAPFSHQNLGGVLAVLHDVTERHRNEERRKEFVANVSHELRTPLTNVRSYAETLRDADGDIPPDMSNSFLDIIINETDRMTNIVQDLLILSRLDAGNTEMAFKPFPFREAIESVVRANALNARARNHELSFQSEGELPEIEGDRNRLEQVMMNIIGNAIKYTPDGGHIRVTAGMAKDRKTVWMDVWDDGIGIPEESRERVFERFYRVDKARSRESGGTGLGLSIAREIVQRHKGALTLPAHDGPGTTVRLELPVTQKRRKDKPRRQAQGVGRIAQGVGSASDRQSVGSVTNAQNAGRASVGSVADAQSVGNVGSVAQGVECVTDIDGQGADRDAFALSGKGGAA